MMPKQTQLMQQLTDWATELQEVRDQFAIRLNPGKAFSDFDRILDEIQEVLAQMRTA